ncbi:MAG: peptide chain release factor N(5)-glutamine methyltransferase [Flavobacteriales bacterium]
MRVADNKVASIMAQYRKDLAPMYDDREVGAILATVFNDRLGWDRAQLELRRNEPLHEHELLLVHGPLARLISGEPVQYVLGSVPFHGLSITVAPGVLIPRPETEEMVHRIISSGVRPSCVVDIGTGSGCIALALKQAYPGAEVVGMDISEAALVIAEGNRKRLGLDVSFRRADVLDTAFALPYGSDLVVSNPPYIPRAEENELEPHVKDHEPHIALFVEDDDPLLFHRAIAVRAGQALVQGGTLWFEAHHRYAEAVAAMVVEHGFSDVKLHADLSGRPRTIQAIR